METAAIQTILKRIEYGKLNNVGSTAIQAEIGRNPEGERKAELHRISDLASEFVMVENSQIDRTSDLQKLGFHFFDALHIACAETAEADVLLTTDDRFLKLALRVSNQLTVRIANPADWLMEIINNDRNAS